MAAYLIGHLDGLDQGSDLAPTARAALSECPYLPLVERLAEALRQLWRDRDEWQSMAVFDPLRDIVHDAYAESGLLLRPLPDGGVNVDVPFTAETMPV